MKKKQQTYGQFAYDIIIIIISIQQKSVSAAK